MKKIRIALILVTITMLLSSIAACVNGGQSYGDTVVVSFNRQGGSGDTGSITVTVGEAYGELPIITKDGLFFAGWYTEAAGGMRISSAAIVENNRNHTLYARFVDTWAVTIFFNLNYESLMANPSHLTVGYRGIYGMLPAVSRENHVFAGWFLTRSGEGNAVIADTVNNDGYNHFLYAKWIGVDVPVTFNLNGGSVEMLSSEFINAGDILTRTYNFGEIYGLLPVPTRTNSVFLGWFTANTGGIQIRGTSVINNASAHVLYARFRPGLIDFANSDDLSLFGLDVFGGYNGTLDIYNNRLKVTAPDSLPPRWPGPIDITPGYAQLNRIGISAQFEIVPGMRLRIRVSFPNNAMVQSLVVYDNRPAGMTNFTRNDPSGGIRLITPVTPGFDGWGNPHEIIHDVSFRANMLGVQVVFRNEAASIPYRRFYVHSIEVI